MVTIDGRASLVNPAGRRDKRMFHEITDNRLVWLTNLTRDLANAMRKERELQEQAQAAFAERVRIEQDIERIVGYVEEHAKRDGIEIIKER